jgi:hypothetical protein
MNVQREEGCTKRAGDSSMEKLTAKTPSTQEGLLDAFACFAPSR